VVEVKPRNDDEPKPDAPGSPDASGPNAKSGLPPAVVAGLVVALVAVLAAVIFGSGALSGSDGTTTTTLDVTNTSDLVGSVVPPPTDVTIARVDGVPTATWTPPSDKDAKATGFRVSVSADTNGTIEVVDLGDGIPYFDVGPSDTSAPLPVKPDSAVTTYCVQVATIVGDQVSDLAPTTATCLGS
jgi:hypothetical protein